MADVEGEVGLEVVVRAIVVGVVARTAASIGSLSAKC